MRDWLIKNELDSVRKDYYESLVALADAHQLKSVFLNNVESVNGVVNAL